MDPVSLVVAALAAGVNKGVEETVAAGVSDAYKLLRSLLSRWFGSGNNEQLVQEHAQDPETWEKPLAKSIRESGAAGDEQILAAACKVLELTDPTGTAKGKYTVHAEGSTIGIVGDHGTVTYSGPQPGPAR